MSRAKKDGVFLNIFIDKKILEELNNYCEITGATKTKAIEIAIAKFLNEQRITQKDNAVLK